MGKSSNAYPQYAGGDVSVNGKSVASTRRVGNNIQSSYDMSDTEKNIYNSVQNNMMSSLDNLFKISEPQKKAWNEQLTALKNKSIENINDIYTPMQNNLRNDIASRFGNLDNSAFMNNLSKITNNKAKAVSELSNNLALTQSDLYTNELQNRINVLNFLNGLNTSLNNNILSYMGLANQNSASGNSYNQAAYNANLANSANSLSWKNALYNLGATTAAAYTGAAISALL